MSHNCVSIIIPAFNEAQVIGEADGVATGIANIEVADPDVVFLDIQMRNGTGFDLLKKIGNRSFEVIFKYIISSIIWYVMFFKLIKYNS